MSLKVRYVSEVTLREVPESTVSPAVPSVASPLVHTGFNTSENLDSTTTPAVTKAAYFVHTCTGGTDTIDLTALTHNGAAVTLNGLRVEIMKVKSKAGNAVVTISEGASNGYELKGNAFTYKLLAGQEDLFKGKDATPVVGGSAKTIDIVGTAGNQLEILIVAG